MNTTPPKTHLFIGGPEDGKWKEVPDETSQEVWVLAKGLPGKLDRYRREAVATETTNWEIFIHKDTPSETLLDKLITGYKP